MQETKSSRIFLLAAVLLGVLAMVLAFVYLSQQDAHREGEISIVVAAHDLPAGRPVDPATDFEVRKIPAHFNTLAQRGVSVDTRSALRGQRLNRTVLAGTPVMLADFSTAADLELAPGKVGLSVAATGANALSGLLVPGDLVKVLVTRPVVRVAATQRDSAGPQWETQEVVNEPLRVLAVGTRLVRSRQQLTADQYNAGSESDAPRTVTLEVSDEQARAILEKTGAGQLPVTLILVKPAAPAAPPATMAGR